MLVKKPHTLSKLRIVAICVSRANLSRMVQEVTEERYATKARSSLSNCNPPSYNPESTGQLGCQCFKVNM